MLPSALTLCLLLSQAPAPALRIVVDPGHGGTQEGAMGPGGLMEKHLALQLAQRVKEELARGLSAQVLLTREEDVLLPLPERVARANAFRPDLLISLHANSMPTRAMRARIQGIETFFLSASASDEVARSTADRENADGLRSQRPDKNDLLQFILSDLQRAEAHADSSRLAHAVHQRLVAGTEATDRGVQQAPFFVLTGVEAPAILVEVGYISHPEEGRRLKDRAYQVRLAKALVQGVKDFLAARASAAVAAPTGP